MLLQFVDAARDFFDAVPQDLLGDLFLIEDDNFLDRAHAALQILANDQDLSDHNRRAGKRLQRAQLSALDALGDIHFPFSGEQRHRAHLAQVYPHRIVGLFEGATGGIEFDFAAALHFLIKLFVEGRETKLGLPLKHVNPPRADGGEQVVQILWGMDIVRNQVIHLVVGEIALFLSCINEFRNVAKSQAESFSALSYMGKGRFC